jgi:hypothetical protein
LTGGAFGPGSWVGVGPPLSWSGPSITSVPKGRLLPLVAEGDQPIRDPIAQKFTLRRLPERSGALALVFPDSANVAHTLRAL